MGMIPGLPPGLLGDGGPAGESQARTKKYLCMMDSMTNAELDGKVSKRRRTTMPLWLFFERL